MKRRTIAKMNINTLLGRLLKIRSAMSSAKKMIFKIRVKHMDAYLDIPYIWYSLLSDDGQNREGYIEKIGRLVLY